MHCSEVYGSYVSQENKVNTNVGLKRKCTFVFKLALVLESHPQH